MASWEASGMTVWEGAGSAAATGMPCGSCTYEKTEPVVRVRLGTGLGLVHRVRVRVRG